jgi:hypothetical protein
MVSIQVLLDSLPLALSTKFTAGPPKAVSLDFDCASMPGRGDRLDGAAPGAGHPVTGNPCVRITDIFLPKALAGPIIKGFWNW